MTKDEAKNSFEDGEHKDHFEVIGLDATQWYGKSKQLRHNAEILYHNFLLALEETEDNGPARFQRMLELLGLMNSSMLLLGYAIENQIKATLVAHRPPLTKEQRAALDGKPAAAKWGKDGHKLLILMEKEPCDRIALSEEDRKLLKRLQEFTVWAGRYPTPLDHETFHKSRDEIRMMSTDFEVAKDLLNRLEGLMDEAIGFKEVPRR